MKRQAVFVLTLMIAAAMGAYAQVPRQAFVQPAKEDATLKKRKAMAFSMIERTAQEAPTWKDRKLAAEALIDAARLLWKDNPGKAAARLKLAWQMAGEVGESGNTDGWFNRHTDRSRVHNGVLQVALDNDRKLFETYVKQLSTSKDDFWKISRGLRNRTERSHHLLDLARRKVKNDPKLAFELAERSLADGVSYGLAPVLFELRPVDVKLADRLFDLAIAVLRNSSDPTEGIALESYMFRAESISAVGPRGGNYSADIFPKDLAVGAPYDTARASLLLTVLQQRYFASAAAYVVKTDGPKAANALLLSNRLLVQYDRYAPKLTAQVENFVKELYPRLYTKTWPGRDTAPKKTNLEYHDETAARFEGEGDRESQRAIKNAKYAQAAYYASLVDLPRAVKITAKIDDPALKEKTSSFIHCQKAFDHLRKKDLEAAEMLIPMVSEPVFRATLRIAIAQELGRSAPANTAAARQKIGTLLIEARQDIKNEKLSSEIGRLMFGLSAANAKSDQADSLKTLEEAIKIVDGLRLYALKFSNPPEIRFTSQGLSTIAITPTSGFGFKDAVEQLIDTEFDRLVNITDGFAEPERRGVARNEIAKVFLDKHKPATVKPKK